ncbi:hypothetical protein [Vogesella urethralis]|jgi:hypothetical protein|uniref:hypothetical protein n=1 Tax=Vogesella urethralis TaxID=2592656 RepID=UPI0011867CFC|nr:hypothetical protein [Vogesella urethralis]
MMYSLSVKNAASAARRTSHRNAAPGGMKPFEIAEDGTLAAFSPCAGSGQPFRQTDSPARRITPSPQRMPSTRRHAYYTAAAGTIKCGKQNELLAARNV